MVHYGSASINDKKAGYSSLTTAASVEKEKAEEIEEEIKEQTSFIGGVSEELGITADSEESEVMQIMHEMTHQKVRAQDKWGRFL
ncbi:hypothetical protein [Priestia flexa]|uniref:hypothetical protein n=1 Tax=Priestia flexa TaxID=86664 RepID=UPI0012946A1A|nr:hypothetical protein [Priestia flexa]